MDEADLGPDGLAALRRSYALGGLAEGDLAGDWLAQLRRWLDDALRARVTEPNAMVFATADAHGRPSARTVLLKGLDGRGLVLFTNYGSRKGREVQENPYAAAVLLWHDLQRQVVVTGRVERTGDALSDAYFASRPYGSRLGAVASPQSQVVASRDELDTARERLAREHPEAAGVPRPPWWGGLRLVPDAVEFWQGRPDRLHDRLRFRREAGGLANEGWIVERLAP